jgi:hypothetical protein
LAWLVGNVSLYAALPAVPWWIAFFALTIGGERLELSRYLKRPRVVRLQFLALVILLLIAPLEPRTLGMVLGPLALWLLAYDLARVTVRQPGLTRYIAVCLLAGYGWLALGGGLLAAAFAYDAALHAVLLGFVFAMVFGHAPIIFPAVLRVAVPYHPIFYVPLAVLHASLLLRLTGDAAALHGLQRSGGLLAAIALLLFIAVTAGSVVRGRLRGAA